MATAAKTTRKKRGKQLRIEGMEPVSIRDLDEAAETYHEAKLERRRLSNAEDEAKDNLIDKMKQHGMSRYETPDGLLVVVTDKSNIKTSKKNESDDAD